MSHIRLCRPVRWFAARKKRTDGRDENQRAVVFFQRHVQIRCFPYPCGWSVRPWLRLLPQQQQFAVKHTAFSPPERILHFFTTPLSPKTNAPKCRGWLACRRRPAPLAHPFAQPYRHRRFFDLAIAADAAFSAHLMPSGSRPSGIFGL